MATCVALHTLVVGSQSNIMNINDNHNKIVNNSIEMRVHDGDKFPVQGKQFYE